MLWVLEARAIVALPPPAFASSKLQASERLLPPPAGRARSALVTAAGALARAAFARRVARVHAVLGWSCRPREAYEASSLSMLSTTIASVPPLSPLHSAPAGNGVAYVCASPLVLPPVLVSHMGTSGLTRSPISCAAGLEKLPPRFKPGVEVLSESLQSPNFGDACPGFSICSLRCICSVYVALLIQIPVLPLRMCVSLFFLSSPDNAFFACGCSSIDAPFLSVLAGLRIY